LARDATPADGAVDPVPEDLVLSPEQTLAQAQALLDAGRAFSAHEVLEAAWKSAPAGERALWQGLAQIAVGLTHRQRGNVAGARTLLLRGTQRLRAYEDRPPYGIDVVGVVRWAEGLAADVSAAPSPLRLRAGAT
jgi:hypothetical protein